MPKARIAVVDARDLGTAVIDLISAESCHAVVVLHADKRTDSAPELTERLGGAVALYHGLDIEPVLHVVPQTGVGVVVGARYRAQAALAGQPVGMSLAVIDVAQKRPPPEAPGHVVLTMDRVVQGRILVVEFDHKHPDEGESSVTQTFHDVPGAPAVEAPPVVEEVPAPTAPPEPVVASAPAPEAAPEPEIP